MGKARENVGGREKRGEGRGKREEGRGFCALASAIRWRTRKVMPITSKVQSRLVRRQTGLASCNQRVGA